MIYDLGMSQPIIDYIKGNSSFIYRSLDWDKYPDHVRNLCTYSWKTIIWSQALMEFGSIGKGINEIPDNLIFADSKFYGT